MDFKKSASIFPPLNFTEEKLGCPRAGNEALKSHLRPHQTLHRPGGLHSPGPLLLLVGLFSTPAGSCPARTVSLQNPSPSCPPLSFAREKTSCDLAPASCKRLAGGSCLCHSLGSAGDAVPRARGSSRAAPQSKPDSSTARDAPALRGRGETSQPPAAKKAVD